MMLSVPLPSFRLLGQRLGQMKNAKKRVSISSHICKKVPDFVRNQELFGGPEGIRTLDLSDANRTLYRIVHF